MKNILPSYHETLSAALNALTHYLFKAEIIPSEDILIPFQYDGIKYNSFKESHVPLSSIKNKATKKYGHVTIWRNEVGRYEINYYSL